MTWKRNNLILFVGNIIFQKMFRILPLGKMSEAKWFMFGSSMTRRTLSIPSNDIKLLTHPSLFYSIEER